MNQFEHKIREIFFYVGSFGIRQSKIGYANPKDISEEQKTEFQIQVHKGFRIGQALLLEEILRYYKDERKLKKEFDDAKKNKEEVLKKYISIAQGEVKYRIKVLRHFADFMAWQMFKGQYYRARRFHSGKLDRPDLLNTNLQSVIEAGEYFYKLDKRNFALITDLTSFIDVGDLLLRSHNGLSVVECKSGVTQVKVDNLLQELANDNWMDAVERLVKEDKTKAKSILEQAKRTLNQQHKGTKVVHFLEKERGTDTFSDKPLRIYESDIPEEHYYEELVESLTETLITNRSVNVIENIVFLVMFRDYPIDEAWEIFKSMLDNLDMKHEKVDYLHQLNIPIKEPIFMKPFGEGYIFDILMGRIKLFLAIDIDGLIELFNKRGLSARWMSRKETNKYLDGKPEHKPYMYNHQSIMVNVDKFNFVLGSQFLTKILLDNLKPSSFVDQSNVTEKRR